MHFCLKSSVLATLVLALPCTTLAAETKRELLARHDTTAVYEGTSYRLCRGRTAMCPERCGDSGEYARFKIVTYRSFDKHSEYGKKQETFVFQISDFDRTPLGDPAVTGVIRTLSPGDQVHLVWKHEYVTRDGASFPERPVVLLEKESPAAGKEE